MPCRLGQILVFSKIRAALGIMSTIISGGGSLAAHLDDFYEVLLLTSPQKSSQYPSTRSFSCSLVSVFDVLEAFTAVIASAQP